MAGCFAGTTALSLLELDVELDGSDDVALLRRLVTGAIGETLVDRSAMHAALVIAQTLLENATHHGLGAWRRLRASVIRTKRWDVLTVSSQNYATPANVDRILAVIATMAHFDDRSTFLVAARVRAFFEGRLGPGGLALLYSELPVDLACWFDGARVEVTVQRSFAVPT